MRALLILALAWPVAASAQLLGGDDVECGILNEGDVTNSDQTVNCGPDPELVEGIDDTTRANNAMLVEMLQLMQDRPEVAEARASGITDRALVELARRIADDVDDPQTAFAELERAVEVAIAVQREGRAEGGDFVDEVLRRMAALSATGDYDAAAAEIDAALTREEAESRDRRQRLLDAGIEQDILRRDAASAATRLVRKTELDLGLDQRLFDELSAQADDWFERGKKSGLNFELSVASELARLALDEGKNRHDRGAALNTLGKSLAMMGAKDIGRERLDEALAVFRRALRAWKRGQAPQDWARTQINLGNTLVNIGQRETSPEHLFEAVSVLNLALEELPRDSFPEDWAKAQASLGYAMWTLRRRNMGPESLEGADTAFRLALEEMSKTDMPFEWSATQLSLGSLLVDMGTRERSTERLEEGIAAIRLGLAEISPESAPLGWAEGQSSLGVALATIGVSEGRKELIEESVEAYRLALDPSLRDRAPGLWAQTQMNLGMSIMLLGMLEPGTTRLEQAAEAFALGLEELTREKNALAWALAQLNLVDIEIAYFDKTRDAAHLDAAQGMVEVAGRVLVETDASQYGYQIGYREGAIERRRQMLP